MGMCCTKDKLDWVVIDGHNRQDAVLVTQQQHAAPAGSRGEQLRWVRAEVLGILDSHKPDSAVLRVAEPSGRSISVGRCEVEGVVQEALASRACPTMRASAASLRGAYHTRTTASYEAKLLTVPLVVSAAAARRAPFAAGLSVFPD